MHIVASTSVPFTLTTVQVPNLALTRNESQCIRIFEWCRSRLNIYNSIFLLEHVANLGWLNCRKFVIHVDLDAEVAPEC